MPTLAINLDQIPHGARRVLRLTGPDTERFLQGLLSADVSDLPPGASVPAALLTAKGQLVAELVVIGAGEDTMDLVVPADVADDVAQSLDRHIIMDEVTVSLLDEGVAFAWPALDPVGSGPVRVVECRHPAPGSLILGPGDPLDALPGEPDRADPAQYRAHRVESASPGWRHELTPGRLPPELGFVYAVSYEKGCFLGQEPLSRVHSRGQVNRVMVRVRSEQAPGARAELSAPERERAGEWTTWSESKDGVVGLALVHRTLATPGSQLRTADGITVQVTSGPLGDDPGVGGRDTGKAARVTLGGG